MGFGTLVEPDQKDLRWWDSDVVERGTGAQAESIFAAFRRVAENDRSRMDDYRAFTRIYENRDYLGIGPESYAQTRMSRNSGTVINISKQVVDTITAKLAKTRPHVKFQTFSGNRSLQRRAKHLERWVESEQYRSKQERQGPDVFKDCCIYGTGIYKHLSEGKRIKSERTHPSEIFVDLTEAWNGDPDQMFQRKYIDREVLVGLFPKKEEEIRRLTPSFTIEGYGRSNLADQLEVVEVWKKGRKGAHAIAINGDSGGLVVQSGGWKRDTFPFTFIRWTRPRRGFWGIGLVEELMSLHIDINRTARQIQKNLRFGNFQVWMDTAAKIKQQKLTNEVGAINTYRGTAPQFNTIDPVSSSLLLWFDSQIGKAFQQAGISMDSATGTNTLGADVSGKSRAMFHDLETVRFAIVAREWEWLWLDSAEHYITLGKEISKQYKDYTVVGTNDRYTVSELKWADVDMDRDTYVIRCAPISALSDLPSTRRAEVNDMMLMGVIDPTEGKHLLDMPDLDAHLALDRAASNNIDRMLEQMLDDKRYEAPEPFQDHTLALKKTQAAYQKALCDGVPEDRLELLRQYMSATNQMLQMATAAQQGMMQPGAPGVPPAPGASGQSPMAVTPADGLAATQ